MTVSVRGKNLEVTPALRAYVEKNAAKLARYFSSEVEVQAVLSVVREEQSVEITCFVDGIVLRGVERQHDLYAAIDIVFDKIIRQIHKHKTRLAKRSKKNTFKGHLPEFTADVSMPVAEDAMDLVRRKSVPLRPMDVEEALLQMNLLQHDFFFFLHAETEQPSVVYRRRDGSYGLIEPEL